MKACTFTSSAPEHCIDKINVHNIELLHSYLTTWGLECVVYVQLQGKHLHVFVHVHNELELNVELSLSR